MKKMKKKIFLIFSLFLNIVFFGHSSLTGGAAAVAAAPAPAAAADGEFGVKKDLPDGIVSAEALAGVKRDKVAGIFSTARKARSETSRPAPDGNFCDEKFTGQVISINSAQVKTLNDLVARIYERFGVNFVIDPEVGSLPLSIKAGAVPWATLLRAQLFVSGAIANCVAPNTIQLIKRESAPLQTDVIKLRFIRPTTRENVDVAGQRATRGADIGSLSGCGEDNSDEAKIPKNCGRYEKLLLEIQKILALSSDEEYGLKEASGKRSVSQVPGRSVLIVRATSEELNLIKQLVALADRPPFQIVIKGLVYTTNETRLRDIGVTTNIIETAGKNTTGSVIGEPIGNAGTVFNFSTVIGSFDFDVQARALERNGVISVKSRPFATVLSGETTDLTVGRQIPVILQAPNTIVTQPGSLEILQAGNLLSVTPNVIDDENGVPTTVNLELQIESNEVDLSVASRENVPVISARSIQTRLLLNQDQTVILGGFTLDSDNRTVTKIPGLGDIPLLGELFKRRVRSRLLDRIYFAISVSILPYSKVPEPVKVPGATTDPPSITPRMERQAIEAEPKQVTEPKPKKKNRWWRKQQ